MENKIEEPVTHNNQETVVLPDAPKVVSISQEELDDLKHKADVSSQNYERAKKAENRVKELETLEDINLTIGDGDESITTLTQKVSDMGKKLAENEVKKLYPQLEEVWQEFELFKDEDENKGMSLKTAAKAFVIEKGLSGTTRKGLEKPTGGPRVPVSSGMSTEEIKKLRETDYRKYVEMLNKEQIKFSS